MGFHSVCRPWLFLCALRPDAVDQRLPNVRILRAQALTEIEFHVLPIDKNYGLWVAPCLLESTYPAHCLEHFLAYRHAVAGYHFDGARNARHLTRPRLQQAENFRVRQNARCCDDAGSQPRITRFFAARVDSKNAHIVVFLGRTLGNGLYGRPLADLPATISSPISSQRDRKST